MMAHRGDSTEEGGVAYQSLSLVHATVTIPTPEPRRVELGLLGAGTFLDTEATAHLLAAEKTPSTHKTGRSSGNGRTPERVEGCPRRRFQLRRAVTTSCITALTRMWRWWRGEQLHPLQPRHDVTATTKLELSNLFI
jgi:hypothetical protein